MDCLVSNGYGKYRIFIEVLGLNESFVKAVDIFKNSVFMGSF